MTKIVNKAKDPKRNMAARAREIGATVQCLRNWTACGVDVYDDDQVRDRIAKSRHLPHGLKPEWMPKVSTLPPAAGDDPTQIDIEAIIAQLSAATDKHQAQTIKIQIDGLLNAYKLREAAGKYVSKPVVEESLIRIAAAVKAAVRRMEADLPSMMVGANSATMQRIIREKVDEVMTTLSDAAAEVWRAKDAGD